MTSAPPLGPLQVRPITDAEHLDVVRGRPSVSFLQTPAWATVKNEWRGESIGWFSPAEVPSLATGRGRRAARAWANQRGIGGVMKKYTKDATRLAFTRQRLVSGKSVQGAQQDESDLLAAIVAGRARLQAPPAQPVQYSPPVPR